jgi:hypothetical protein
MAERVLGGEQGHAMLRVGVEVDAGHVAPLAELVALEEKAMAVVVARVGPRRVLEHEIGVLVGSVLDASTLWPSAWTSPGAGKCGPSEKYP